MLHQTEQAFVIMNLQGGHFLFRGQKHDARCTSCYILHDVLLECVLLIKPTFIKRKTIRMITHTAVRIILFLWAVLKSLLGLCTKQQRMKKKAVLSQ